jgi:ribosomal protein S18 acetylase RimI-like enzyme
VNTEQNAAVDLYKQFGFNVVGRLKNELRIDGKFYDELIMEKLL